MGHPVTLAGLAAAGLVLALAGPFGTDGVALTTRLAYWPLLIVATYGAAALVNTTLAPVTRARPFWQDVVLTGLVAGAVVAIIVLAVNRAAFGIWPDRDELPGFLGTLVAITLVVNAVVALGLRHGPTARDATGPPPILHRLPLYKRAPLVALSVEDHYVRIRTLKGEEMVLMRLADAMREVGDTPGAQVHRSHWVGFGQVRAARRDGDRALLTMAKGPDIPVSRANLPKIKEAGLLPR
jgi:hypothetical protein